MHTRSRTLTHAVSCFILSASVGFLCGQCRIAVGSDTKNDALVFVANGENYAQQSLEALLTPHLDASSPLAGFEALRQQFLGGKIRAVDAFGAVKKETPLANIRMNVAVSAPDSAVLLFQVETAGVTKKTFLPMSRENGEWKVGSPLFKNQYLVGILTLYVNTGVQLSQDDFARFLQQTEKLNLETELPLLIPIDSDAHATAILPYTTTGAQYQNICELFSAMLNAFTKKEESFYTYWDTPDATALKLQAQTAPGTSLKDIDIMARTITPALEQCAPGYEPVGVAKLGNIHLLFIKTADDGYQTFFLKDVNGTLKFTKCELIHGCDIYLNSLFASKPFQSALIESKKAFPTPAALSARLQSYLALRKN